MAEEVYGLVAEFDDPDRLLEAARAARERGYTRMDAYTPFPVHGLLEALGKRRTRLQWIVFLAAVIGGVGGYLMQYWIAAIDYPINVGGKPLNSWPNFIPVTFEVAVLISAITAAVVMFARNGLPQPYHPLFRVEEFARASQDRFFLCIQADDPQFDLESTRQFLEGLNPLSVEVVEP